MREFLVTISALYALYASHGRARLRLIGTVLDDGFHFDAIVHEFLYDDRWACKTTITHAQFQAGSANERQIVALHKARVVRKLGYFPSSRTS
jgi:hypothetical protein